MATFIPNLFQSAADKGADDVVQAYVDTPGFVYSQWLDRSGDKIGSTGARVGIVGDGPAGCCAAYELAKAGADVTLVTISNDHNGGRTYSDFFLEKDGKKSKDIAELGAMRFPPSEETLFHYFYKFGIKTTSGFPDPGKQPTWVSYQHTGQLWSDETTPPKGFENVHNGFVSLVTNGIHSRDGAREFPSSIEMSNLLKKSASDQNSYKQIIAIWQKYLDYFGADSWYSGLRKIFAPNGELATREKIIWTEDDFTRFGTLGIGSGGFGPLYNIGFLYIYRLLVNQLETNQLFVPSGISSLADNLLEGFQKSGGKLVRNTRVLSVKKENGKWTIFSVGGDFGGLDYVIVATSNRSMEISIDGVSVYQPDHSKAATSLDTAEAINRTHMVPSSKFFIRTKKFWEGGKYPRNILSDTRVPQVYTLDYGDPSGSGVVLGQYTWEDASIKTLAITDPEEYLNTLLIPAINEIMEGTPYEDYSSQLVPFTGDVKRDLRLINWETEPYYYGGFTLARPGQDSYIDQMFHDFSKSSDKNTDTHLYIAGDSCSWSGGWIEGALHTGLNAAAAVIFSSGGTFSDKTSNPVKDVAPPIYTYYPKG